MMLSSKRIVAIGLSANPPALLGEPANQPVAFAPSLDLTRGYGRSLADHITLAVTYLENDRQLTVQALLGDLNVQAGAAALGPHNIRQWC